MWSKIVWIQWIQPLEVQKNFLGYMMCWVWVKILISRKPRTSCSFCADLTSRFDVIVPYFTCASSWDHKFLLECVLMTHSSKNLFIHAFTLYNFHVQVMVCVGASSNLALIKLLCGYEHEQLPLVDGEDPFAVSASFDKYPYEDGEDKQVFVVICPSHQVTSNEAFVLVLLYKLLLGNIHCTCRYTPCQHCGC